MEKDIRRELEEKILSKRQQIEFERTNLTFATGLSEDNRENPDSMEEAKNFDDPADNVADADEIKSLSEAEKELDALVKRLKDLDKS